MASISKDQADKIMESIGYERRIERSQGTDNHECWYRNKNIEAFSISVGVRLKDAGFMFLYIQGLETMTRLQTDWFSPLTSKKHFMKWFKIFMDDAIWFAKKYDIDLDSKY